MEEAGEAAGVARMLEQVESIRLKFELLRYVMDARMTRLWARLLAGGARGFAP